MAAARIPHEVEIKLRVPNAAIGRRLLRKAGFRVRQSRSLESNVLYDYPNEGLRKRGLLVRLREYAGECFVTYKGRAGLSKGSRKGSLHRSRPEYETTVGDAAALVEIWSALGLEPRFRYEKYRSIFERASDSGGLAMLDETPIGCFLELEGEAYWIDRIALILGFSPADYIHESYVALYAAQCRKQKKQFGDMIFGARRKINTRGTL
jgi:adenylate cyclase class 2